jgi:hypothetical protein
MDPALPESQLSARLEEMGAQAILLGPPAVGAAPVVQVHVPAWTLRVDISRGGRARATLDTGATFWDDVHAVAATWFTRSRRSMKSS